LARRLRAGRSFTLGGTLAGGVFGAVIGFDLGGIGGLLLFALCCGVVGHWAGAQVGVAAQLRRPRSVVASLCLVAVAIAVIAVAAWGIISLWNVRGF